MKKVVAATRVLLIPWFVLRWTWQKKWAFLKIVLLTGLIGGGSLAWMYYYYIIKNPGTSLSRDHIMNAFLVETPVYYDDGESLLGVFFEREHRIYIDYDNIPKDFVNALIAAEDKNFFRHPGLDPLSIIRAAYVNFRAKKIVQGGSTLTQQTAKNLFKRQGRTFQAKFKELVQALKLEAHYSKEDIIEFFANQFFVSGTGRGLGIAAKYFFDKPVDQLSTVECAFIAGSIRAPNRYNPLNQPTPKKQREAYNRAMLRKQYVVRNMLKLGMISHAQYSELLQAPIPFKKGKIYYQLNVIMDLIRERLQSEKFQEIFKDHGIGNIATSGVKIYTTINRDLQEASQRVVRKHLSQLETKLSGYDRQAVQSRYEGLRPISIKEPLVGQFVLGQVEGIVRNGHDMGLVVKVGDTICKVDKAGLLNLAIPFKQFSAGPWARPTPQDVEELLSRIEVGDRVYGYVRETSSDDGTLLLDLEQKPILQGGLIVTSRGRVLAMVGGFDNVFFNRAADAKRQMGSIFKPLVFAAAQQLGWNLVDPLDNRRDVFVFQDQFYFPRPDHESPHERVSLAWAGVKSENVASVWLLYHLCDQLSFGEFKQIAQLVDIAPREGERYRDFQKRIRDSWGIIVTEDALRESAFQIAKEEISTDLIFEGKTREAEALGSLKYGSGFDEYRELLREEKSELDPQQIEPSLLEEYAVKESLLKKHFLGFMRLYSQMQDSWEYLQYHFTYTFSDPAAISDVIANFSVGFQDGREVIAYGNGLPAKGFVPLSYVQASLLFKGNEQSLRFSPEDILIDGEICAATLSALQQSMERELTKLKRHRRYEMATLWHLRDYRILVGLLYVRNLGEVLGFETPLEPVLSFPLGPTAVSILEVAQAYATFLEGKQYIEQADFPPKQSIIIDRIVDAQGEEIYRYVPQDKQILDSRVANMVSEILENVVNFGTGAGAKDAIAMELDLGVKDKKMMITIPTLGKTGTANEYSNSSYIGFVPGFSAKGETSLSLGDAFVVASYVGYDDNKPMKNSHIRIFGASGALPIWIDVANKIVNSRVYQQSIDPVDFAFLPESHLSLTPPPGMTSVPVDEGSGLPLPLDEFLGGPKTGITLYSYGQRGDTSFKPQRFFVPFPAAARDQVRGDGNEKIGD